MSTPAPRDINVLPDNLPVPQDDGAARHLTGLKMPAVALPATDGSQVDLAKLSGRTVVYIYPRTGVPGQPSPAGWDAIPGARGCTPQSCSFRDHFAEPGAELADGAVMNEVRSIIERSGLTVDDSEQRAVALGDHGK